MGGDDNGGPPTGSPTQSSTPTPSRTPTQSTTSTSSPTPTPTTPNNEAVEHYEEAVNALVSNKETLDGWAENGFEGGASDLRELRETLSTATDALNAAENAADPAREFRKRIEQATLVATVQEGLISFYDLGLNYFGKVDDASKLQENEEHDRAAEAWADAEQLASDIGTLFDDTQAVHAQINTEVLDEPELDYSSDFIEYVDLGHRREIDAAVKYTNGFEEYNYALFRLGTGLDEWKNEAYVNARSEWKTGRSRLEAAQPAFKAIVDNSHASEEQNNVSIEIVSIIESLFEVVDTFIQATHEAEDGNTEKAEELINTGLNTLDQLF